MNDKPELVVMLTHHDLTVGNAAEVFEQCRQSKARCWGFKEHPLPFGQMRELFASMKAAGKTTFLEVVAYTEAEGLEGAKMAAGCQCDILMGTCYHDSILRFCLEHDICYMPFVGRVEGRPSVLSGSIDSYERLQEVCDVRPWAFTIGSAFFEHKFGDTICQQIDNVCDYINMVI